MNLRRLSRTLRSVRALTAFASGRLRPVPILDEIRGYDGHRFRRDGRAALHVALLAVPQGLAFAMVAGLPLEYGIYGAIAGLSLGAIFAGSRHVSFGPSLATAVLLLSTFVQLGIPPDERPEALLLLLVLSGALLLAGAWFDLGKLTRFISRSVTAGFMTAAGLLVAATQLKWVLGLEFAGTGVFLETLVTTVRTLRDTDWPSLLTGGVTAGSYLALHLRPGRRAFPAAAFALLAGSLAAWFLRTAGYELHHPARVEGGLLPVAGAAIDFSWVGVVASAAFAMALLAQLETSLVGRSLAASAGAPFNAGQHMFGLGMASLGNAFFSGMPASVSLARSHLLRRMRAATPFAGVLAALACAAVLLGAGRWLALVPTAALAALVMVMASETIGRHSLHVIVRSTGADAVVLFATIAAGLLFRLDMALYLGAGLSIVFFLRRVGVPELSEYGFTDEGQLAAVAGEERRRTPDISIVHVEGDLFFGAAEIFLEQTRRLCEDPALTVIVLRMKNAHHLDATCALAIEELLRFTRDRQRHILVSGAHRGIYRVFRNSGLLDLLGRENFFMDVPSNPTISTRNALRRAQQLLGGQEANIRIFVDPAKRKPAPAPA